MNSTASTKLDPRVRKTRDAGSKQACLPVLDPPSNKYGYFLMHHLFLVQFVVIRGCSKTEAIEQLYYEKTVADLAGKSISLHNQNREAEESFPEFCEAKLQGENRPPWRFSPAQGIAAEIPQTPGPAV
jgi:hypothetical protein